MMPPDPAPSIDVARALRVLVAGAPETAGDVERLLQGVLPGARATWVRDLADIPTPALRAFDTIFAHFDGSVAAERAIEDCAARADVPVIAFDVRLGAEAVRAAIDAGAADCFDLGGAADQVALALARAAAQAARREAERARRAELDEALDRARRELAELRAAAITDWLTGLYNKRHFEERLAEEEGRAYRTGAPLSLIFVDIDRFKAINDAHGHEAGDRVLAQFADIVRRCVRGTDIACRSGGEEFALILPETMTDGALAVAERIRHEVSVHRFDGLPPGLRVTASFGVATLPAPGSATRAELVRAADRALFCAKEAGRDRSCVAGEPAGARPEGAPPPLPRIDAERVDRLCASLRDFSNEVTASTMRAIETLVRLLESESAACFGRGDVIAAHAVRIARRLGLDEEHVERIRRAAILQELGMVPLSRALAHEGGLAPAERELVRRHPAISVRIAGEARFLRDELPLILHHHERYDGTGYPRGLRGDRTPLGARVLAVATAFEAMTSERPWRPAMTVGDATAEIERLAGTWYDPRVVGAFVEAYSR